VEREQMEKLLKTGKTDLLQFVSARTRRPFSAFLVVQPDGKVGFEFEAKDPTKARGRRPSMALRVLGAHPKDKKPVELHAGRFGPYVKHGDINATIPDRDQADALTLDDAVQLLAAKAARDGNGASFARPSAASAVRATAAKTAKPAAKTATKRAPAAKPAARKSTAKRK
jgi:topoisomerase IA-like protein